MSARGFAGAMTALGLAAAVAALGPGCGADEAVVGGACAAGYTQCGQHCVYLVEDPQNCGGCGIVCPHAVSCYGAICVEGSGRGGGRASEAGPDTSSSGASGSGSSGSSGSGSGDASPADGMTGAEGDATQSDGAGPACVPPMTACAESCVDLTADPFHCGQCNTSCPSQICVNSQCVGSTGGGLVFVGHDYQATSAGTAQARVLSNAVLLVQNNPLHVMSYERYSDPGAISSTKAILTGVAAQLGRTLAITSTSVDTDIPNDLSPQGFGVLLVQDQPGAPSGALATLGASWLQTLTTFTLAGGVVVVLDGGTGVGEMPAFATATGLLTVTGHTSLAPRALLDVLAPGDAVGLGVVSPYAAAGHSVSLTAQPSNGDIVYVVGASSDSGSEAPVVIYRAL